MYRFPKGPYACFFFAVNILTPSSETAISDTGIASQTPVMPKSVENSSKNGNTSTIPRSRDKICDRRSCARSKQST